MSNLFRLFIFGIVSIDLDVLRLFQYKFQNCESRVRFNLSLVHQVFQFHFNLKIEDRDRDLRLNENFFEQKTKYFCFSSKFLLDKFLIV
jgi:hypothetical protein